MDDNNNSRRQLILNKHVGLIHCESKLTLIQRKLCNVLLFNALDNLNKNTIFEIGLKQLCILIGYTSNDTSLIKKSLKSLLSTVIEWDLLDKEKFGEDDGTKQLQSSNRTLIWHASSLLAGVTIEGGFVSYSYSPQIKSILSNLEIYGKINLFIQSKFKSSYSLVLYENCVRFKNIATTCWFELELFRKLMGVEKDKYIGFKELKRNAISPAIEEINTKSDILVEPEYRRIGKKITAIKFSIKENPKYYPRLIKRQKPEKIPESGLAEELQQKFKVNRKEATLIINKYGEDYVKNKIQAVFYSETFRDKQIKNLKAYLISFLKNDYQTNNSRTNDIKIRQPDEKSLQKVKEENKAAAFQKRYLQYKHQAMLNNFFTLTNDKQAVVEERFAQHLKTNHNNLLLTFKTKRFQSIFVLIQFNNFIETELPELVESVLSYEDYITADMDEL